MSQIQGMRPEPPHRKGDQGINPAASLLPTDGGSVGDGHAAGNPRQLAGGTMVWPEGWDALKIADWKRRHEAPPEPEMTP